MKQFKNRKFKQGGWTMVEVMSAITISGVLVAGIMALYVKATTSNQGQNVGSAVADMASKIQKNFAIRGSYDTLIPATVNGMGLVASPLVWASGTSKVQDPWGNVMAISGNAVGASATFGTTIGGATGPIDKATCTDIATQLMSGADVVNVGAAATVANGLASGGTAIKSATVTPDPAALATACSAASPVIAVQWH